jgi:hypothetical protein
MTHFAKALLFLTAPRRGGTVLAADPVALGTLLWRLVLPGSLASAVAVMVGVLFFNRDWDANFGYDTRSGSAGLLGVLALLLSLAYAFVLAGVFMRVARLYRSECSYTDAFKVVAYGTLPVWVAGAFMFFMPMVLAGMAAFVYSCVLYSIAADTVLGVPERETTEFVAISLLLAGVAMTAIGMIATAAGLF